MLPVISLDTESYEEIFEKAKRMIPRIYPEWTDFNEHDPGITFLQLFSWLKEMQQFHLDQIGKEHLELYLKLLGMKQKRKQAASTLVEVRGFQKGFSIPKNTKLLAGNIFFETEEVETLEKALLLECVCISQKGEETVYEDVLQFGNKMRCYPFGMEPETGNRFLLKFGNPFQAGKRYRIYLEIADDYPVKRNPIHDEFYPLVEIRTEYYGKTGFSPCENVVDHTNQLLHSGILEYTIPEGMEAMEDGTYGVCLTLLGGEYDVAPLLQDIAVDVIKVSQKLTLADYEDVCISPKEDGSLEWFVSSRLFLEGNYEIYTKVGEAFVRIPEDRIEAEGDWNRLRIRVKPEPGEHVERERVFRMVGWDADLLYTREFEMTGFPYQTIDLNDLELLYDSFAIMTELPGKPEVWVEWEKVDHFYSSTPSDRHYRLEEEQGKLYFGDCEMGLAPEGKLRIIRYARSQGFQGNVRKGQIQTFDHPGMEGRPVNREDVSGGREKESIDACFARFQQEFGAVNRAVTASDFEILTRGTPGLRISKAKVVPTELMKRMDGSFEDNCVSIVVQPFSYKKQAKLSAAYIKNILRLLNERRLIGTKVQILSPEYIGVMVFADIVVRPHYLAARDMIEKAVNHYFEETISEFGAVLEESELYGLLDALDCVIEIRNLTMQVQGRGTRRTANGNIQLPVNGLAYLKQTDYLIADGEA